MRLLNYILFILTALSYSKAYSQSEDLLSAENKLIDIHHEIDTRLTISINTPYDSIAFKKDSVDYFVERLDKEFTRLITDNPKTIDYTFKRLPDSSICIINTSVDGNFRVYNLIAWQLRTEIYQWRDNNKVFTKVFRYEKDSSGVCVNIFTIQVKGQRYYLPFTAVINFPEHSTQSVAVWRVNGSSLEATKLFKKATQKVDHIDVSYSWANYFEKCDSLMAYITYDDKEDKLYIPFLDEWGLFTKFYFIYELKDELLEFTTVGEMKKELVEALKKKRSSGKVER